MVDNFSAKKSLGQHWLVDQGVLNSICDLANVVSGDKVLEIGPGKGALTKLLIEKNAIVTAVELDEDAIKYINKEFKEYLNNQLILEFSDIRKFDLRKMGDSYKIVANIPYYLTSHLIQIISESQNPPNLAVLLVQKEVAERLCAHPGTMSILAITSQFYWETSLGVVVAPSAFTPPPKVDSQVVLLKRRTAKLFEVEEKKFFRLVKSGFSSKRKTLLNSLSGGLRLPKNTIQNYLDSAGVISSSRPQELSLLQWKEIYDVIKDDI